jgi:hypothetical protein
VTILLASCCKSVGGAFFVVSVTAAAGVALFAVLTDVVVVFAGEVFVGAVWQAVEPMTSTRKTAIFQFIFLSPNLNFRNKKSEGFTEEMFEEKLFSAFYAASYTIKLIRLQEILFVILNFNEFCF